MTTAVQHRRGTTSEHSSFTGLEGEVTIDTTKDTAVIHDAALAGGRALAREDMSNATMSTLGTLTGASTAADDTFLIYDTSISAMKSITRAELNNALTIEALDTVDINGGTIDGTTIGATTPSTGAFTTLSSTGNTTLGDASTDTTTVNGYLGVGGAANSSYGVRVSSSALTGTQQIAYDARPVGTVSATSSVRGYVAVPGTVNAAFTCQEVIGFLAAGPIRGASSTITTAHGVYVADQTQGTNNYGITSLVSSGTNKWNIYASGTAANYFAANSGFGTTAPLARVHASRGASGAASVNSAADLIVAEDDTSNGISILTPNTAIGSLFFGDQDDNFIGGLRYDHANDSFQLYANNAERLRIDSSGNVGIGTSSPTVNLELGTNSSTVRALAVRHSSVPIYMSNSFTGAEAIGWVGVNQYDNSSGSSTYTTKSNSIYNTSGIAFASTTSGSTIKFVTEVNETGPAERMRIDSAGNVGIGTSSPSEKLNVVGGNIKTDSSSRKIGYWESDAVHDGYFTPYNASGQSEIVNSFATGALLFKTGTTKAEAMRIDSSGKVGIGTTASTGLLTLSSAATSSDFGQGQLCIQNSGSNNGRLTIGLTNSDAHIRWGGSTTNGSLIFSVNDSGSERMRIDASGNLGLGVTPGTWAAAAKAIDFAFPAYGMDSNGAAFMSFNARNSTGSTWVYKTTDEASKFTATTGGAFTWETAPYGTAGNPITFTQAMTLDASGNLGIGITNPSAYGRLAFSGNLGTTGSQFNMYPGGDYEFVNRNSYKMNFYVNGASVLASLSITGVWTNASDARYKENIVDSQYGLATVMALQPRAYNLIDQADKPQIGFIAQEVLEVVPEVVDSVYNSVTKKDRYTLSYGNLVAVLTKAIQEQQALIESQAAVIAAMETRLSALEA